MTPTDHGADAPDRGDREEGDRDDTVRSPRPRADDPDTTVVSSRPRDAATGSSAGALGPTAVSAHEDVDETERRPRRSRPAAAPARTPGDRRAVEPDADALRSPQRPRADGAVRVPRDPVPAPPSGGAVPGDGIARARRRRAFSRVLIAVAVVAGVIAAAVAGIATILG
ncbi:hypothetical protein P0L94_10705 [Microbacter sp. GSS18]|nr:hypothetical protein P0L94_10705 [Microbacter sp. GSS18]